jgi:hypothetical protein
MGNHQLESLPARRPWKRVVGLLGEGTGMAGLPGVGPGTLEAIADATMDASEAGLSRAKGDDGLSYAFYLLTQVTQAARQKDFARALDRAGVRNPALGVSATGGEEARPGGAAETVYELVANFTDAVDRHLRRSRSRTDIGELAQRAAAESLTALCTGPSETLWGTSEETVQKSLKGFSTKAGFARLSREFFGRLAREYLVYHLSRELSNHVGRSRRFTNVAEHNEFLRGLDHHCRTSTVAIEDFAGTWYSKHNFMGGITREKAQHFVAHALDKMREALQYTGGTHGG